LLLRQTALLDLKRNHKCHGDTLCASALATASVTASEILGISCDKLMFCWIGPSDAECRTVQRTLRLISEADPTDTCIEPQSIPPILNHGTEDLICGGCASTLLERVSTEDVYLAVAALLRNRVPARVLVTCPRCHQHNLIPSPIGD
jgi:hypothetical protein